MLFRRVDGRIAVGDLLQITRNEAVVEITAHRKLGGFIPVKGCQRHPGDNIAHQGQSPQGIENQSSSHKGSVQTRK